MKRKLRRFGIGILALTAATTFLACQSDVTEPTGVRTDVYFDDEGGIGGWVKDPFGVKIDDALVEWYTDDGIFLGSAISGTGPLGSGNYRIPAESWWEDFEGYDLEGFCTHPDYKNSGYNTISNYHFGTWYLHKGFELSN